MYIQPSVSHFYYGIHIPYTTTSIRDGFIISSLRPFRLPMGYEPMTLHARATDPEPERP